jgi:hypothetical protein
MPDQAAPAKMTIDVTVMTLITAIGAALGAFAIFQPKLAVSLAMKRETGSIERAFRWLYIVPQYLNATTIVGLCCLLFAAFLHSIRPETFVHSEFLTRFGAFFVLNNVVWILFLAVAIVAVVQFNWMSWILLGLSAFAALLPIPKIRGAFGFRGQSPGWLQAYNICRTWDKGQPLLLCRAELERVADLILYRLTLQTAGVGNFAAIPAAAGLDACANIALFGCILEAAHYAQRWSTPKWSEFYGALAEIHQQTQMFDPKKLATFSSGDAFATRLRNELVAAVSSRKQPVPADKYLASVGYLALTWEQLRRYSHNVLKMVPAWARLIGGRLYWLDRRLSGLPMLNSEGMRPQLIKLLARWQTIPWAKESVFVQPFAKKQAWLLLQETALRVLPEQKDVTFWAIGDIQLTRIACLDIFRRVSRKVRQQQSDEAKGVNTRYPSEWDLFAAADFCLWDLATECEAKGRAENWDAAKGWKWKLEDGRATKIS